MVDFGHTAEDYGKYRQGFPASFFQRLQTDFGIGHRQQSIVDIGCGTGALGRGFALQGAAVIGLDVSRRLIDQARLKDADVGVEINYRIASAEQTALPDASMQVVAAGQCWHWFDGPAAASEAFRVLQPQGQIVICHFDWLPAADNVVEATEHLILQFNSEWDMGGGTGIYPFWFRDLSEAGFHDIVSFSYDEGVTYSHEAWRGRIRASAGIGASLPDYGVRRFDDALNAMLIRDFPDDPLEIPHRIFAIIGRKPA